MAPRLHLRADCALDQARVPTFDLVGLLHHIHRPIVDDQTRRSCRLRERAHVQLIEKALDGGAFKADMLSADIALRGRVIWVSLR